MIYPSFKYRCRQILPWMLFAPKRVKLTRIINQLNSSWITWIEMNRLSVNSPHLRQFNWINHFILKPIRIQHQFWKDMRILVGTLLFVCFCSVWSVVWKDIYIFILVILPLFSLPPLLCVWGRTELTDVSHKVCLN